MDNVTKTKKVTDGVVVTFWI